MKRKNRKPDNLVPFDPSIRPAPRRLAEPQPKMVTQIDMAEYRILESDALTAKEELERKGKYIRDLLEKGMPVEDGPCVARLVNPTFEIRFR